MSLNDHRSPDAGPPDAGAPNAGQPHPGQPNADVAGLNRAMAQRVATAPPALLAEGGYALRVIDTIGRRSGRVRSTPLGVLRREGAYYLVCPDRTRDWAQNLLAHPLCLVRAGDQRRRRRAVPVTQDEAADCVAAYLSVVRVPWARQAFGLDEAADRATISAVLARMAVFRLEPVGSGDAA